MSRLVFILIFILTCIQYLIGENWRKAITAVEDKIVLIEFYEQHGSMESIEEKSRIKRFLSGVIVSKDGLVLTSSSIFKPSLEFSGSSSFHFSDNKLSEIKVKLKDGTSLDAEFVGKDDDKNVGFVKIKNTSDLPVLKFSENEKLDIGDPLLIIQQLGENYDRELIVTKRLINARQEKPNPAFLCEDKISTGIKFGIALDEDYEVIGILIDDHSLISIGEGSVLSSGGLLKIMPYSQFRDLIANPPVYNKKESTRKKWLGVYMQPFTIDMAKYFGNDSIRGVLLNTIIKDSPAEKAGLQSGDVIMAINNVKVDAKTNNDLDVFREVIRSQQDSMITIDIFRDGKILPVSVQLAETPISQFLADEVTNSKLGFSVKELTQDIIIAKQLDFETEGVWVSKVEQAGWADVAGLVIGDLILKINETGAENLKVVEEIFDHINNSKPDYIQLFIKRNGDTRFLYVKTNYKMEEE
ncbi:MAG: PDZ domain-containing protein [Calditrichaceae bacterium]|nr:PDZ domain-containing protein [Calditrichaceae bacterium]MBN2707953.1 PDZ domain-containing protein [Calditrichaceae bacterium]RQV95945.1 MAG: PDZ domain-containing protein [Calditrichota bacterium]